MVPQLTKELTDNTEFHICTLQYMEEHTEVDKRHKKRIKCMLGVFQLVKNIAWSKKL